MKTNEINLSNVRLCRLRAQGYIKQTETEINNLAFGHRFAFRLCVGLLVLGVSFQYMPALVFMMVIAIFGVILPNHPFDYIYNHILSKWMKKPQLPPRPVQLKFACMMAAPWIGSIIYLFQVDMILAGYILGGLLITTASLVSTIDLCIPSLIYNALFQKHVKPSESKA